MKKIFNLVLMIAILWIVVDKNYSTYGGWVYTIQDQDCKDDRANVSMQNDGTLIVGDVVEVYTIPGTWCDADKLQIRRVR